MGHHDHAGADLAGKSFQQIHHRHRPRTIEGRRGLNGQELIGGGTRLAKASTAALPRPKVLRRPRTSIPAGAGRRAGQAAVRDLRAVPVARRPPTPAAVWLGAMGMVSVGKAVFIDHLALNCACVGGNSKTPLGVVSFAENLIMTLLGSAPAAI